MNHPPEEPRLVVRAVKARQDGNVDLFAFFVSGGDVLRIADITRVSRDSDGMLKGFQRKEIRSHVNAIAEFLDQGAVIFPNAIILALSPDIEFRQARGPEPLGLAGSGQAGTLLIPIRPEGQRAAWIVDGQQRSLALAKARNKDILVPIVGFVSADIEVHREQFILVNKARPLPTRLINELLPETSGVLPRELSVRRIPSELCNILNQRPKSPFHRLIRRMSDCEGAPGVVTDTALINVVRNSMNSPLGALAPFKGGPGAPTDIEGMYRVLSTFWSAVRDVFPEAWGLPPTESRLMHSAGIQAMGYLMDRVMTRTQGRPDQATLVRESLERIAPRCAWTEGTWEHLGLAWDEIQNVSRHVRGLAEALVRLDFEASRAS